MMPPRLRCELAAEAVCQLQRDCCVELQHVQLVGQVVVHERSRDPDAGVRDDEPHVEVAHATPKLVDRAVGEQIEGDNDGGGAMSAGELCGQGLKSVLAARHQDDVELRGG